MADISAVNTELDMSQPDGLPKEQPRNDDGTFKKPEETTTPVHPPGLVALAKDFGFSDDEISDFSTNALSTAIRRTRANMEAQRSQFAQADLGSRPAPVPAAEPEFDFGGVKLEEFDEGLAKAMRASHQANAQQLKEVREELAKTRAANEERDRHQTAQFIDDAFEALGPEYEEYFGKGSGFELKAGDPDAFQRRLILLNSAGVDPKQVSGKRLLSALKGAVTLLKLQPKKADAKENVYEQKPAPGGPTKAEWDRGGTAVPTQRNNANEPNGVAKAKKNLESKFREQGLATTREDREIIDTLPKR